MKKVLILVLTALMLCGCSSLEDELSEAAYSGYVTEILEFESAGNWDFVFGNETEKLYTGDSHGGFTLTRLLYRPTEDGSHSVRADFSCDFKISGGFVYNTGGVYTRLVRFYPDDRALFPKIVNDKSANEWLVVREDNDPLLQLGIAPGASAELRADVRVSGFSIHHTQNNTIYYVDVEVIK